MSSFFYSISIILLLFNTIIGKSSMYEFTDPITFQLFVKKFNKINIFVSFNNTKGKKCLENY